MRKAGVCVLFLPLVIGLMSGCENDRPIPKRKISRYWQESGSTKEKRKKIPNQGYAAIKGRVTYKGKLPVGNKIAGLEGNPACITGAKPFELIDQEWLGEGGGVADVLFFVKVPNGKYYEVNMEDKKVDKNVVLDQPHCVYIPHVISLYPSYYDGQKNELVPTGQELVVKNSANTPHNTKFNGNKLLGNNTGFTVATGQQESIVLAPQSGAIPITCDVHSWMKGYAWVFDHPFSGVTKMDGNFEISRAPAGTQITLVAWHEDLGFINQGGFKGEEGMKITLQEGEEKQINLEITDQE